MGLASSVDAIYLTMQVSHTAVRQGQVRSRPGGLFLEALMALPDLAGIQKLLLKLFDSQSGQMQYAYILLVAAILLMTTHSRYAAVCFELMQMFATV